jgi:hypothetical protein
MLKTRTFVIQEIAYFILGTRRASVTVTTGILQKGGIDKYTRGEVNVVNRSELEDTAWRVFFFDGALDCKLEKGIETLKSDVGLELPELRPTRTLCSRDLGPALR